MEPTDACIASCFGADSEHHTYGVVVSFIVVEGAGHGQHSR